MIQFYELDAEVETSTSIAGVAELWLTGVGFASLGALDAIGHGELWITQVRVYSAPGEPIWSGPLGGGIADLELTGFGYESFPANGGFGFGELWLTQVGTYRGPEEPIDGEVPTVVLVGFGDAQLEIVQMYSFGPATYDGDGYGEVALSGFGYETDSYGYGELHIAAFGFDTLPLDSEPDVSLYEYLYLETAEIADYVVSARAAMLLDAQLTAVAKMRVALVQALVIDAKMQQVVDLLLLDSAALSTALSGDRAVVLALIDRVRLTSPLLTATDAVGALAEAIVINDLITSVSEADLEDVAAFTEQVATAVRAVTALVSAVVLDAAQQGVMVLSVLVEDELEINEDLTSSMTLLTALQENLRFIASVTFDGVPYIGLSLNAETRGMAEYSGFDYDSLAVFNGRVYGINEHGMYLLEGNDDAGVPIAASVRTALLRIGEGRDTRIQSAYLGYRSDGTLQLKVVYTDARGVKRGYVYDLQELPAADMRPGRIKVGQGLRSMYWVFELSNTDGADFDLDKIDILPLVLNRRLI